MDLKKTLTPYLLAFGGFLVLLFIYFYPEIEGKEIQKEDHIATVAKSEEVFEHRERFGEEPLWTNSIFSGMPTFQGNTKYPSNLLRKTVNFLTKKTIPNGAGLFFSLFLGMFLLLIYLRTGPWLAAIGGFAFTFSTYFIGSFEAGHIAKLRAIGFIPPIVLTVLMTFHGRWLLGGALTTLSVGAIFGAGHPQIAFYAGALILVIIVVEGIYSFRKQRMRPYLIEGSILLIAAILAIGPNCSKLWTKYEYAQESTRAGGPLAKDGSGDPKGIEQKDAFKWSYGKMESFNLMIPGLYGASSNLHPDEDSHTAEKLKENGVKGSQLERYLEQRFRYYWGPQPMTNAPNYIGAVVCFLFILGFLIVKGKIRWWILAGSVLALMMAWGRHLSGFNEFLFNNIPLYNKFRAPSMTLTLLNFTAPLMGILAVREIIKDPKAIEFRKVKYAYFSTGGICLLFILLGPSLMDFEGRTSEKLSQQKEQLQKITQKGTGKERKRAQAQLRRISQMEKLYGELEKDRKAFLQQSSTRSLIFITIAFVAVWGFMRSNLQLRYFLLIIAALVVVDLWTEDRKYLNSSDWSEPDPPREYRADCADLKILLDDPSIDCPVKNSKYRELRDRAGTDRIYYKNGGNEDHYRVYNRSRKAFNENFTAYHHKSIGGYHAAKLARYQDLIDRHLKNGNPKVLNMLNTRWFIDPPSRGQKGRTAERNPQALGNAWFVDQVRWVDSAEQEINALNDLDPKREAIVHDEFKNYLKGRKLSKQNGSSIRLEHYRADRLRYQANVKGDQGHLAVFSEVYYEGGGEDWKVTIDGKRVDHIRSNYILRALWIPPGEHEIVFEFKPQSYYVGEKISLASSILIFLLILVSVWREWKRSFKGPPKEEVEDPPE